MFKKISQAYEVLSDPTQKQIYDAYGEEGLKIGGPPPPPEAAGGGGGGGGGGGVPFGPGFTSSTFGAGGAGGGPTMFQFGASAPGGGMDNETARRLFESLFGGGGGMDFSYSDTTGGGGGMPSGGMGFGASSAFGNGGKRFRPEPKGRGLSVQLPCTFEEFAMGSTRKLKVNRDDWDYQNAKPKQGEPQVLTVNILPGYKAGTKLTFESMGDAGPGGRGDVIVELVEKPSTKGWRREENDLVIPVRVSLVDALCGFETQVPNLVVKGSPVSPFRVDHVVRHGERVVLADMGFPIRRGGQPRGRGDAVLAIEVDYPRRLTADQKQQIRQVLGPIIGGNSGLGRTGSGRL